MGGLRLKASDVQFWDLPRDETSNNALWPPLTECSAIFGKTLNNVVWFGSPSKKKDRVQTIPFNVTPMASRGPE